MPPRVDRDLTDQRISATLKDRFADRAASDLVTVRDHPFGSLSDRIREKVRPPIDLSWPKGLWIPGSGDPTPFIGTPQRYTDAWVTNPVGWGTADKNAGTLLATGSSPTVGHAIHGTVEAGLGVQVKPSHPLSRLTVEPDVNLVARHRWAVDPGAQVGAVISTRVTGVVRVGGLVRNLITGAWETIDTSQPRDTVVFDDIHQFANGESAEVVASFNRKGPAIQAQVLVEAAKTYLLYVAVRVTIDVTTQGDGGRPISVTNGHFDTFGSLTGAVPQIWVDETVFQA